MSLLSIIQEGGLIMVPLLLCSLIIWAVLFQKAIFIKQFSAQSANLYEKAEVLLKEKKLNEAKGLCHNVHPFIARPFLTLFEKSSLSQQAFEAQLNRRLRETQLGLKKSLWILGTIGASAPFIGLFGTVVGIIKSFESIASSGKSGFAVVAAGLGEALIATAAGILVAVMAVVVYNYFQSKLTSINLAYRNQIEDLGDLVS